LKLLSAQGEGPVYLAALSGSKKPWVIKAVATQGTVDLAQLRAETKRLSRMHSSHLTAVLASPDIENDGGFVMEYVPGKSLAEICERAEEYSVLLPPELGLVVAHDAFAAAEFFHAFDDASRVHGNLSPRTILISYSGDVKVAGYRPGSRASVGSDAHMARDLKSLATLLFDLRFEMFPKELAKFVPFLLEDGVSPVEAMAAARAFLHDHMPSIDHRRKVAVWLEDLFPDHQCDREAQEEEQLLAAGMRMLVPSRPVSKHISVFGGTTALLALVGGGILLVAHRGPGQALSQATQVEPKPSAPLEEHRPMAEPEPLAPALEAPAPVAEVAPTESATVSASIPKAQPVRTAGRPTKPRLEDSHAERLLHAADAAFGEGKRIEAITMGIQALGAGGGIRAHLALGEYYRSLHRYQEALNHYRAVVELEPDNKLALAGVKLLEKKVSPCQ
jgi:tetratricopeptide (TPR) repeat protein